jgi:cell division inhibitor SepF
MRMGLFDALRRQPEEDLYDDYEDYEESYPYDEEAEVWQEDGLQPIRSIADMQVVKESPKEYKEAAKIADLLRSMKFVVIDLSKTDSGVARRLLDFISGVAYSENGHIMKIAIDVYAVVPYFVDLRDEKGSKDRDSGFYF